MKRPARWLSTTRGVLLVEAVLSAVVIGVGLAFISQGLSNQLKALSSLEASTLLASLAERKLLEVEAERAAGTPLAPESGGRFAEPYQHYEWTLHATPRADVVDKNGQPVLSQLMCAVRRESQQRPVELRRSVLWRTAWVPPTWF